MSATFDPDNLRASLLPLSVIDPLSMEGLAYQRFYGLAGLCGENVIRSWLGRLDVAGYEVVGQVWLPDSPVATLFLFHGFYDHMGLYRHVIEWALEQGFAVIACDLPGHGLSSGSRACINDFAEYQLVLQRLLLEAEGLGLPHPWHLCGQSMGGAIVTDHLLHQGADSPAHGGGDSAGAAGPAARLGLVASELSPAQTVRERHCPPFYRKLQCARVPAFSDGRSVTAAATAHGLGRRAGAMDRAC